MRDVACGIWMGGSLVLFGFLLILRQGELQSNRKTRFGKNNSLSLCCCVSFVHRNRDTSVWDGLSPNADTQALAFSNIRRRGSHRERKEINLHSVSDASVLPLLPLPSTYILFTSLDGLNEF